MMTTMPATTMATTMVAMTATMVAMMSTTATNDDGDDGDKQRKYYIDTTAAAAVNGNTKNPNLPSRRSFFTFEFGGDRGYWTSNHVILQVEECIDCLHVLTNNRYGYAFLFDHSSGHAKNALEVWTLER
jgi:hypothetical protein